MNTTTHPRSHRTRLRSLCLALIVLLPACAEWNATPVRVEQGYGLSSRALVVNSQYDPRAVRRPAALAPDGMEAQKATTAMQRAYQNDIGDPRRVRAPPQLNISGGGQSGMGTGGSSSSSP